MAEFYTAYNKKRTPEPSESGSPLEPIYKERLNEKGKFIGVEPTGEYDNIYEKIQSYKDETDIHTILERYANGDMTVLNARSGKYIDVSAMPNNFNDLIKAYKTAQETINQANIALEELNKKQQDAVNKNQEEIKNEPKQ